METRTDAPEAPGFYYCIWRRCFRFASNTKSVARFANVQCRPRAFTIRPNGGRRSGRGTAVGALERWAAAFGDAACDLCAT